MKKDGVSIAFDMILEEMSAVEDQLAAEGGSAFMDRRYDDAERLTESGKTLLAFRQKLEFLRAEWMASIDAETRERVKVDPGYTIAPHTKGSRTILSVTLPTGRVIQQPTAADTFADVIEIMGLEPVLRLGLSVSGVPLVSRNRHEKYDQKQRGAFYVVTHSNTQSKKTLLETISAQLGQPLQVDIVERSSQHIQPIRRRGRTSRVRLK